MLSAITVPTLFTRRRRLHMALVWILKVGRLSMLRDLVNRSRGRPPWGP